MYRIAFNPELPVHAASSFQAAGQQIAQDAPIDWRALGVSEQTLYDWWRAGLVYHPMPSVEAQEGAGEASEHVDEPDPIDVIGEMLGIPTDAVIAGAAMALGEQPKLTRRERRALRNQG